MWCWVYVNLIYQITNYIHVINIFVCFYQNQSWTPHHVYCSLLCNVRHVFVLWHFPQMPCWCHSRWILECFSGNVNKRLCDICYCFERRPFLWLYPPLLESRPSFQHGRRFQWRKVCHLMNSVISAGYSVDLMCNFYCDIGCFLWFFCYNVFSICYLSVLWSCVQLRHI